MYSGGSFIVMEPKCFNSVTPIMVCASGRVKEPGSCVVGIAIGRLGEWVGGLEAFRLFLSCIVSIGGCVWR